MFFEKMMWRSPVVGMSAQQRVLVFRRVRFSGQQCRISTPAAVRVNVQSIQTTALIRLRKPLVLNTLLSSRMVLETNGLAAKQVSCFE
jgi:hypothetical protein